MERAASVMISIRTALGVSVGHADVVRGYQISFWVNVPLRLGQEVEFRLELPGADDTVLGFMRIKAGSGPPGSLVHYQAEVEKLDKGDLLPFERWLADAEAGHVSLHLRSGLDVRSPFEQMHGATKEQTENALRRLEERKARFAHIHDGVETPVEELFVYGLFEQQPAGTAPVPGKPAAHEAAPTPATRPPPLVSGAKLASADWWRTTHEGRHRHDAAVERQRKLAELLGQAEDPVQPAPPAGGEPEAPAAPPAAPQGEPDPHPGVYVALLGEGERTELTVGWLARDDLLDGPIGHLLAGFLRIRRSRLPEWPRHTHVHLVTPGGQDLHAEAFLAVEEGGSVVYQLALTASARDVLLRESTGQD